MQFFAQCGGPPDVGIYYTVGCGELDDGSHTGPFVALEWAWSVDVDILGAALSYFFPVCAGPPGLELLVHAMVFPNGAPKMMG